MLSCCRCCRPPLPSSACEPRNDLTAHAHALPNAFHLTDQLIVATAQVPLDCYYCSLPTIVGVGAKLVLMLFGM